jgi:hypothetical protein
MALKRSILTLKPRFCRQASTPGRLSCTSAGWRVKSAQVGQVMECEMGFALRLAVEDSKPPSRQPIGAIKQRRNVVSVIPRVELIRSIRRDAEPHYVKRQGIQWIDLTMVRSARANAFGHVPSKACHACQHPLREETRISLYRQICVSLKNAGGSKLVDDKVRSAGGRPVALRAHEPRHRHA